MQDPRSPDDLKQQVNAAADKVADAAKETADKALRGAEDAVHATKEMASDAMDAAESKVRKLRDSAEPVVNDLAAKAQDLASKGIEYCAERQAKLKRQLEDCAHATTDYVQDQPAKALFMAAAGGAALAFAMMALGRRRY